MLKRLSEINKLRDNIYHEENQYLNLIDDILTYGNLEEGRNGNVKSIFGASMHFSLSNNTIPILTSKKVAWKTCLRELLWFINGCTDNKKLNDKNVHIWDANSSREFLDSRGLSYEENDLGPVYGHQWRFFNADYINCHTDYKGEGVDQLQYIIDILKSDDIKERYSRRLVMSAWNPCQINKMALPPCHVLCQFNVTENNKLSCSLYQRSADMGLGVPFNIASYSFLTHLLSKHCNLEAQDFYYYLGNCHIYESHIDELKSQINKPTLYDFPTLEIKNKLDNINDYDESVFVVNNYKFSNIVKMKMIA
jgi:thymidylate synthase